MNYRDILKGCSCSILIFTQEREDLNLKVCSHMKVLLISCSMSCLPSDSCTDRCQTLKFRLRHVTPQIHPKCCLKVCQLIWKDITDSVERKKATQMKHWEMVTSRME
jgi:hypothetical protein